MKSNETSEKVFEREVSRHVESIGGVAIKMSSAFIKGLPDRLFIYRSRDGFTRVEFAEFKSTGKKPTKIQLFIHEKIRHLGIPVYVIDSVATVNEFKNLTTL